MHIAEQANTLLNGHSDELHKAYDNCRNKDGPGMQDIRPEEPAAIMRARSWVWDIYSILVKGPRKKLAETMERLNIEEKSVILVVDECRSLDIVLTTNSTPISHACLQGC